MSAQLVKGHSFLVVEGATLVALVEILQDSPLVRVGTVKEKPGFRAAHVKTEILVGAETIGHIVQAKTVQIIIHFLGAVLEKMFFTLENAQL